MATVERVAGPTGNCSMTVSASLAMSARGAEAGTLARMARTCAGMRCGNSSRSRVSSILVVPRNCSIRRKNWVGLRSPRSSALSSCCKRLCSVSEVRLAFHFFIFSKICFLVFLFFKIRPPFLFSLFNVRARVPFCLRPKKKQESSSTNNMRSCKYMIV